MSSLSTISLAVMARALADDDGIDAYRAVLGWMDEASREDRETVVLAIDERPALTGDVRVDALLAAAAEHVSFHAEVRVPAWLSEADRFLRTAWFPIDLPSIRVRGLVSSPASFARRGIFIDRSDLDRV